MVFPVIPVAAAIASAIGTVVTVEVVADVRRKRREDKIDMAAELTAVDIARLIEPPALVIDQARVTVTKAGLFPQHAKMAPIPVEPDTGGLIMWGDGDQPTATWRPSYLHSRGCKDFRWGVCIPDFMDSLRTDPDSPQWGDEVEEVIRVVANVLAAGAGNVSEWLMEQLCLRYKWPLKSYTTPQVPLHALARAPFPESETTVWAVVRGNAGVLQQLAPPHPFHPVPDWKRVWVSTVQGTMTRNDNARIVMWAREDEDSDAIAEIVSTDQLRGMLRMDYKYTGAVNAKQLAGSDCDKSKWWIARRSKAMPEFR